MVGVRQRLRGVLYRLRDSGYGAYLVGGAVRDLLVGGHPKDFDIATSATPEEVRQLFRNSRLIGRRFRLAHVVFGREIIEVATFRANVDDGSADAVIDAYMDAEVLPHIPDAWLDRSKTRVGYEVPFTRHFYTYVPPRPLVEIDSDLNRTVAEILDLLQAVEA